MAEIASRTNEACKSEYWVLFIHLMLCCFHPQDSRWSTQQRWDEMRWGKKEKSPQDTLSNEDPGGGWMLSLLFRNNPSSSKHCRVNVEVPSSFTLSQYEKVSLSREILTQGIIDKPVYALCRWRKSSLVLFQKGSAAMLP